MLYNTFHLGPWLKSRKSLKSPYRLYCDAQHAFSPVAPRSNLLGSHSMYIDSLEPHAHRSLIEGTPLRCAHALRLADRPSMQLHTPEQQLVAAVLELAVDDLRQGAAGEPLRGEACNAMPDREGSLPNTVRWFESNESTRPLSFIWCCKALGLEAAEVRAQLHAQGLPV